MINQANIKVVLGGKPLADGNFNVYLRIIKNRKKKEIALGLKCDQRHFVNEQFTKSHKNHRIENELLLNFKQKALNMIRAFQLEEVDFTLADFENKFRGVAEFNDNFFDFWTRLFLI